MSYNVVWKPLPGSQSLALSCPCDEILFEGTRGPGKTAAQLARFRRLVGLGYGTFWRGIIFDTEYKNLADIITQSKRMYRLFGDGARFLNSASELRWVWPTGEELLFRFGKEADDYWDYHGQEFPFIGFNELTKQPNADFYESMFSCRRSSFRPQDYPREDGSLLPNIPLETFNTTNPFGIGHTWVKKRFIAPAPRGTIIREKQMVPNPQTQQEEEITLTRVAIHGSFKENPYLDPVYIATLMSIKDPNKRKAWVEGSWDVTSGGRFDHLWNESLHVIKPFTIPETWTVDRSHDWGESKPFSNLWWAQSDGTEATLADGGKFCPPAGSLVLIGEWYGCPDTVPAEADWKSLAAGTSKTLDFSPNTTNSDADDTGGWVENLTTNADGTVSFDGEVRKRDRLDQFGFGNFVNYFTTEIGAGRQPTIWVRVEIGPVEFQGYMVITALSTDGGTNDIVTFSTEFKVADGTTVQVTKVEDEDTVAVFMKMLRLNGK